MFLFGLFAYRYWAKHIVLSSRPNGGAAHAVPARTWRLANHYFRDAAEEHVRKPRAAMCGKDNQINLLCSHRFIDGFVRHTSSHYGASQDPKPNMRLFTW